MVRTPWLISPLSLSAKLDHSSLSLADLELAALRFCECLPTTASPSLQLKEKCGLVVRTTSKRTHSDIKCSSTVKMTFTFPH